MKTVLHIINSLQQGGAETLLANSLSKGGLQEHTNNILVYFHATSILEKRIDSNVKVYNLGYNGLLSLPSTILRLREIIKQHKIDIVHSHLNPASFYTQLACPKKIPHVHTLHIAYTTDFETRSALRFLEKKLLFERKDCNVIFLSEFTKNDFLGAVNFKGQPFVLNNFIDDIFYQHSLKQYTAGNSRPLKLLAVGYLRPQKNYFYLLEIFKHLKTFNIHLDIYGGGDKDAYNKVITDNNLKVTLKGPVANINEQLDNYDLFIMASANEGFPLSVFEAMAAGVPLMLSDIKPLTSIVKENAIYFDLNDASKAAGQLVDVLNGAVDINTMAQKAKAYAEKTVRREIYMKKLLEIYDTIS
jgi:glycosyltransferase involved in cell wall biosynthesis